MEAGQEGINPVAALLWMGSGIVVGASSDGLHVVLGASSIDRLGAPWARPCYITLVVAFPWRV